MNEYNSIDKLFQKELTSQETLPPEMVWTSIEKSLVQKKKKRALVFWFLTGAIVSLVTLTFALLNIDKKSSPVGKTQETKDEKLKQINSSNEFKISLNTKFNTQKIGLRSTKNSRNQLVDKSNEAKEKQIYDYQLLNPNQETIFNYNLKKKSKKGRLKPLSIDFKSNNDSLYSFQNGGEADRSSVSRNEFLTNHLSIDSFNTKDPFPFINYNIALTGSKTIIEKMRKSSLAILTGPMYFSHLQLGSTYNSVFDENKRNSGLPWNIGIQYEYQITTRLSSRIGFHTFGIKETIFDVGYITKNPTDFTPSDSNTMVSNSYILSNSTEQYLGETGVINVNNSEIPIAQKRAGEINQKTRIIEIPIEMGYTISKQRLGIGVYGGISALFLIRNEAWFSPQNNSNERIKLDSNPNLSIFFTTLNGGLKISYSITPTWKIQFEPKLKYEIGSNALFKNVYQMNFNLGASYKF